MIFGFSGLNLRVGAPFNTSFTKVDINVGVATPTVDVEVGVTVPLFTPVSNFTPTSGGFSADRSSRPVSQFHSAETI